MGRADRELYVYAVADPDLPFRLRVLGRSLRTLTVGPLSAVVQAGEAPPAPTADRLHAQHALVTALARRSRAILPARFGTRLTEGALRSALVEYGDTLSAALDRVRDRTQMTVRSFGPPDRSRPAADRARGGAAYLTSRRNLARHAPPEIAAIRALFGDLVTAERVEAGGGVRRLTVFHLIPAEAVDEYRRRAPALQSKVAPLQVTVTGPWPPFAFAPELF